ncbi:hypothetical protein GQ602_000894 [Ophiocordyceps camponoti-floridani]|uniref:Uncharacterized protein n=1 Tax=Ophiocordyceps camponoti-floridani TaxID=2030778 RepID=A0A8H4QD00_9HYPO|nr:hypothetical protein GQ602_000894 [Ophiocordyceps camponoti-floridani]
MTEECLLRNEKLDTYEWKDYFRICLEHHVDQWVSLQVPLKMTVQTALEGIPSQPAACLSLPSEVVLENALHLDPLDKLFRKSAPNFWDVSDQRAGMKRRGADRFVRGFFDDFIAVDDRALD